MSEYKDDLNLAKAVARGEEDAARAAFGRLKPFFERVARQTAGMDYDEVVGDSLAEAILNIGQYRGEASLETWGRSILINTIRRNWARDARRRVVETEGVSEARDDLGRLLEVGDEKASRQESLTKLEQLSFELPSDWNNAWQLRCGGKSDSEISDRLQVPVKTVERWLRSARERLTLEFMKVDRAAVEDVFEEGWSLSQKGQLKEGRKRLELALAGLATRKEATWVWDLKARSWKCLAWIEMTVATKVSDVAFARASAARNVFESELQNCDEAVATDAIELTLFKRRHDLEAVRAVWQRIQERSGCAKVKNQAEIHAGMADCELGLLGARTGQEPDACLGLVEGAIRKFEKVGFEDGHSVGLIRRAEVLIGQGRLGAGERSLDEAESLLPRWNMAVMSVFWYTRQLAAIVGNDENGVKEAEAMVRECSADRGNVGGYLAGLRKRQEIREKSERKACSEGTVRELMRAKA